jgi:hypothetical protein
MIYKTHYQQLRNSELLQFMNDLLSACNQYSTDPMKLAAFIVALTTDIRTFDSLFKLNPKSAITQELINLDNLRDNCLKGIHALLEGYGYHFVPAIQSVATLLLVSMDNYGKSLHALNYPSETSTVNSLVSNWTNKPDLAAAITTLNLGTWVTELSSKNASFAEKYISRANEKALEPQVKTFDARVKAIASCKTLTSQIEAGARFMNDNSFDELINLINQLVVKYNIIADSHIGEKEDPEAKK